MIPSPGRRERRDLVVRPVLGSRYEEVIGRIRRNCCDGRQRPRSYCRLERSFCNSLLTDLVRGEKVSAVPRTWGKAERRRDWLGNQFLEIMCVCQSAMLICCLQSSSRLREGAVGLRRLELGRKLFKPVQASSFARVGREAGPRREWLDGVPLSCTSPMPFGSLQPQRVHRTIFLSTQSSTKLISTAREEIWQISNEWGNPESCQ